MSSTQHEPEGTRPQGAGRRAARGEGTEQRGTRRRAGQPGASRQRTPRSPASGSRTSGPGQDGHRENEAGQPDPGQPGGSGPGQPGAGQPGGSGAGQPGAGQPGGSGAGQPGAGGAGPQGAGLAGDIWQRQVTGLGAFIRVQRRLADMSLREMANLTSVSNAYLSQIERGLHQPSLRVLRSIAQALSIAPEDLLRRANFMTSRDGEPAEDDALPDTEAAIRSDPRLTPAQREALLNVYRSFRDPS